MEIHAISREDACAYLEKFRLIDPAHGQSVAQAIAQANCFKRHSEAGTVVFALQLFPLQKRVWICAAAGNTSGHVAPVLLREIEREARKNGFHSVGFQTIRPGLKRIATRAGYTCETLLPNCWNFTKALHAPD